VLSLHRIDNSNPNPIKDENGNAINLIGTLLRRHIFSCLLLCIFIIALTPTPAIGLAIQEGQKVTDPEGETSAIIIIEYGLVQNGTISINISGLRENVASGTFTEANINIQDTASAATWTAIVEGDILTLSSTGSSTEPGETVLVTFTGSRGNPWITYTEGIRKIPLTAITNSNETASFNFFIQTGGLNISGDSKITSPLGVTTSVITITDALIVQDSTITVDISQLNWYVVASGSLTTTNIGIEDSAMTAVWTATVEGDILTLTSTGGTTEPGESVTVSFTGAGGNPWVDNTGGAQAYYLATTRSDGLGENVIPFVIETGILGGLAIQEGEKITEPDGQTSSILVITDSPLIEGSSIVIDIQELHMYVDSGIFTDANVIIDDNAANAEWAGYITNDTLTLISIGGDTAIGERINVTFTGALGSPWIIDTDGEYSVPLTATRTDIMDRPHFIL
jgi:hypothetical protein